MLPVLLTCRRRADWGVGRRVGPSSLAAQGLFRVVLVSDSQPEESEDRDSGRSVRREPRPSGSQVMETSVTEIAPNIYRLSTYIPEADFMFNQFLIDTEQPLLFHTGLRSLFPLVSSAAGRIIPIDRLRWITFGHVEADECGSMNSWLLAAPHSQRTEHWAAKCR